MQFRLVRRAKPALRWIFCVVMVMIVTSTGPMNSWADMVNGSAEFDVSLSRSKSKDATGAVISDNKGTDFMHKYNVSLDTTLFPLLKISAGSSFLQDISILHDTGTTSRTRSTTFSPYFDAMLTNSLYQAAIGYSRNENWQSGMQEVTPASVNEEYHATLGWRPAGLPDLSMRLSHTNTFDVDRLNQDTTTNMATVGTQYNYKALKLGYQFTGTDTTDNLHGTDNTSMLNNGSVSYSDQFFNQRVSVYSHYNTNYIQSTTKAGNGGIVDAPLFPTGGISGFNSEPIFGTADQNTPNSALIDGNFTSTAGINLGVVAPPGNTGNKWSIGLDFTNPTEVNKLIVWVDRQLPSAIVGAFSWQVWIRSGDTDNWTQIDQNGTPVPANSPNTVAATFGPFQNSFTLSLNHSVKTRFIKVVVNTLPQSIALANPSFQNPERIFVTELQGMLSQAAAQVEGSSSRWSQNFNMDVRTRLLDSPSLYHSMNLSLSNTTGGELSYVLDNSLILDHRLNQIFTVAASAGREDISSGGQSSSAYLYSASLKATPLEGLNNTLVYSGRLDQSTRGTTTSNSVFFTNTAQPYKGIAFNLSGGYSLSTNQAGQESGNWSFVGATSITPRQDLNFNLSYNRSITTLSGGTGATGSSSSQSGLMAATYRPFTNLYLFASLGVQQSDSKKTQYVQNYGGTWSPFPDGTLQFNVAYNESINSINSEKNTSLTPTVSWKIAPKAMLSLSYSLLRTDSLIASTEATYLSSVLRLSF